MNHISCSTPSLFCLARLIPYCYFIYLVAIEHFALFALSKLVIRIKQTPHRQEKRFGVDSNGHAQ